MPDKQLQRILITTSTLPASADDPVPAFVRDQVMAMKAIHPELEIHVMAPHNAYTKTHDKVEHDSYTEYRFHYFWPFNLELLAGRGIAPALKAHTWLYLVVPFLFLFEMIATYRLAKRIQPDLLYVHWFTPQGITAAPVAKRLGLPLVFTTHASDVAVLKKIPGAKEMVNRICRQAKAYTAVSEQTAERLRWFWDEDLKSLLEKKMHILPMGTDVASLPMSDSTFPELEGTQVVLFIGRIVQRKGIFELLESFKKLYAAQPSLRLVVAGDGQDKARLVDSVTKAGLQDVVIFPGYVSGQVKADWLSRADILCLPSINEGAHAEGLPVVFMEGLAAGKIIVASDVTGAQEYIKTGKNGFVFPEKDVPALSASLQTALTLSDDQRLAVQAEARTLADNFSWPKVAEAHYTVLKDAFETYNHKNI